MKIGFDLDGVLTYLVEYQLKAGKKYFGDDSCIDDGAYDICNMFNCSKEESEKFWTKYIWKYCLTEPIREGSKELIDKLKSDGDKIYIITGRAHTTEDNSIGKLFRKMVVYYLKKNGIKYDEIYYCSEDASAKEKYDICKKIGIDIMFEDKTENIESLKEIVDKVICVDASHNRGVSGDNVYRVYDFSDVYNIIKNKDEEIVFDNNKFDKDKFKTSYGIVRNIGSPLFKILLKPNILNKEFIPKEGSLILCGNHLHVWDQFPVICSTKRTTHWMSKKEYFDSKMGPFFRKTGAISVDRYGDAHAAENEALNYLDIGSCVGLFPEGTRNHLKDEKIRQLYDEVKPFLKYEDFYSKLKNQNALMSQVNLLVNLYKNKKISREEFSSAIDNVDLYLKNSLDEDEYYDSLLLPFKYGTVSMAKKTNSTIVPFAVTGDYTIGNHNLVVNFGEGFKVGDMSLEEANDKLRGKVLELIKENKKM